MEKIREKWKKSEKIEKKEKSEKVLKNLRKLEKIRDPFTKIRSVQCGRKFGFLALKMELAIHIGIYTQSAAVTLGS